MAVFHVFSIGDAEMMHNAFQGVAMIFNAASMNGMVRTGFAVGLLLVGARYLVNLQFTAHQMLAALIAYSVLFTVRVSVSIEDAYTAQVRTVANIPIGVAAPMSVVSNIGYDLTQMFETAFSTPDEAQLFQHGYGDALRTLLKLRGVGSTSAFSDAGLNGDVGMSLNHYIDGCVRFDLDLPYGPHEATRESLLKAPDLWAAMKTTFINKDVIVYLPNVVTNGDPYGKQLSCEKAYETLNAYLATAEFKTLWDSYMKGRLGIKDASEKAEDRVGSALAALNVTATDAQTYMLNALMASLLRDGPAAVLERTAMEQLQMQWSGEQGVFKQVARPMMAFVETFTVAASPLAAVLVTLGPIGLSLAARYLLLVAWVSLWGPVMAVCNMYITVAATHALDALSASASANGAGLASMVMQDELFQTLDTWVATGGMLAASVPAITLMLIYGAAVTATNLAGKMTSGVSSSVQQPSKALAPDPINVPATVQGASQFTANPNVGAARYGVQQPTYSAGSSAERSVQSAYTGLRSASAQVMNTQSQMVQTASRQGHNVRDGSTVTDLLSNSKSSADRYAAGVGRQIADKVGTTEAEKRAISSAMSTNVGAALSSKGTVLDLVSPLKVEAGVSAALSATGGTDAARTKELSDAATNAWNNEHANSSEFRSAHDYAKQHADESVFSTESMQAHAEQYQSQLSRVKSAQDQYAEAAAQRDTASHVGSVDYNNLASRLVGSGKFVDLSNYDRDIRQSGDQGKIKDWQNRLDRAERQMDMAGYMDYGQNREALGRFLALDSKDSAAAVKMATEALMPASGGHVDTALTADSNKGLKASVEDIYGSQEARGDQRRTGESRDTLGLDGNSSAAPAPAGNPDRNPGAAPGAPRSEAAPGSRPKARQAGDWSSDESTRMSQIRGYLQERKTLADKFPPPKSGAGKSGMPDMPGEDTPGSPVKRLNIPQADAMRKQIEGTNLEKRAKDSYRDSDNSGMVGTALKRTDAYSTMRESAKQAKEMIDTSYGDPKPDSSNKPPIRENGKWNDLPDAPNSSKK